MEGDPDWCLGTLGKRYVGKTMGFDSSPSAMTLLHSSIDCIGDCAPAAMCYKTYMKPLYVG